MTDSMTVYHKPERHPDTRLPDPHQDLFSLRILGFWVYLMTDAVLFGTLFVTFAVLRQNVFGGPSSQELFSLPLTFAETMFLLCSSVTCGFALLAAVKNKTAPLYGWLIITILFGLGFLSLELHEFNDFIQRGYSWKRSAFLSSFFTLVGTHGLHVTVGLFWAGVLLVQLYLQGLTVDTFRRLVIFNLFWHFLDLIWIFVFTIVYLMGVI